MAYMQRLRITKVSNLDDDSTWRFKLPSVGLYTAFEMRINCNRHATRAANTTVFTLADEISKIEILKGGAEVVKSLTGEQLDAMNYWDFKRPNARRYRQEAATGNDLTLFVLGGRGLYDKEYGFDMARLGETYLEYTYDLSEGVAEHFEANDHDVSLYGYRWMGPGVPSFRGYFRDRQIASWTTSASSAIKTIAIPVGNPIRRIAVQATTRGSTLGGTFSELEVRVNDGEYSPVIVKSPMDWTMAEVQEYGLENLIGGIEYVVGGVIVDLPYWFSYYETLLTNTYGTLALVTTAYGALTLPARIRENATTATEAMFAMRGWGFQKCLRIGFDHEHDGFDLLQTAGMGSLDLVATEAAASKVAKCFVQDVISY